MEKFKQIAYRVLLAVLLAAGLLLRCAGLNENLQLHPDEPKISLWMQRMSSAHSILPATYAGGFFVLADAAQKTLDWTGGRLRYRWAYWTRAADRLTPPPLDPGAFGRPFNAVLGTLIIGLVALWTRRITRSRAGALIAATLMAFSAYPVEHAHYLETDIAMLATLTLSLTLLTRTLATRRTFDLALAALATGFASGTKFPLALLVVPLVVTAFLIAFRRAPSRGWALAGLPVLALLLAAAGFITASPDVCHFSEFVHGAENGKAAVYAETAGLLGDAAASPHARMEMNAANLYRFAKFLGWPWLLMAPIGAGLCFTRRYRRFWPATLLFPALYVWFFVFKAPWTRSQEFMTLLPSFCLWAAFIIAAIWNARSCVARPATLVLACALLWPVLRAGVAMSSQFAWEDTRRLANRTLQTCYPPDKPLGAELYTSPADHQVALRVQGMDKVEDLAPELFARHSHGYVLRNIDMQGRGIRDPRTGRMFPEYAERMELLLQHGQRLASWGTLDSPAPQATFRAPGLELWSRPDARLAPQEELGADLPRPSIVRDTGRTTFFKGDLRAGPTPALFVDKYPRDIAIGGPGKLDGPVFLVFCTREREATVRAQGFGRCRRLALGPYDAGVIALQRPRWNPRWSRYEHVVIRSETGCPTLTYLPCFLRVAFDPLAAASLLLDEGQTEKAVDLLRQYDALASAGPFWQVLAGNSTAKPAAAALLARWEQWLAQDDANPPPVLVNGMPLVFWQDFARIRLTALGDHLDISPLNPKEEASPSGLPCATILPVFGATQQISLAVAPSLMHPDAAAFTGKLLLQDGEGLNLGLFGFSASDDPQDASVRGILATAAFPRQANLYLRSCFTTAITASNIEYTWSWRDMLALRADQLRQALAATPRSAPVRFGNWLALRSCRLINGQAQLAFEALRDFVPPMNAQLRILKHGKWRGRATVPLGDRTEPWRVGELHNVTLPLEPGCGPERSAVAVVTAVPFHPSRLPWAGAPPQPPYPLLSDLPHSL